MPSPRLWSAARLSFFAVGCAFAADHVAAEDAYQEAFVAGWCLIAQLKSETTVGPWLCGIAAPGYLAKPRTPNFTTIRLSYCGSSQSLAMAAKTALPGKRPVTACDDAARTLGEHDELHGECLLPQDAALRKATSIVASRVGQ